MVAHIQHDIPEGAGGLTITRRLAIPAREIRYRFSHGSGPGGQNVNKVSTRVDLLFDIGRSASLTPDQKSRLRSGLGRRVDSSGVLTLASGESRSQWENRRRVTARFVALLQDVLRPRTKRVPTKPHGGSKEKRLTAKRVRSQVKSLRGHVGPE